VLSFRSYDETNRDQGHSRQDVFDTSNIGHHRALTSATTVLRYFYHKSGFNEVEDFLRNVVYRFSDGAANKRAGENLPPGKEPKLGHPRANSI
jgi:hypothetical protein